MKIAEITYQTNLNQLLDYNQLCAIFEDCDTKVKNISDSVISELSNCISQKDAGLDPESFSIDGNSLLHQKATELKSSSATLVDQYENLKAKILEEGKAHSEEELNRYIKCLTDRIATVEQSLSQINTGLQNLSTSKTPNLDKLNELITAKNKYTHELEGNLLQLGLKMKLELAKQRLN